MAQNFNTYNISGIDRPIKLIQDALFKGLNLSDVDFYGRVEKSFSKDLNGFVAEVYTQGNERKEVYYNDMKAKGGNVFFITSENSNAGRVSGEFENDVNIVFMINLKKVFPDASNRMDTELQSKVVTLLKRIGYADISGVSTGVETVLNGFAIDYIKQLNQQPFHTFSVNVKVKFNYNSNNC